VEERTDEAQAGSTTGEGLAAEHRIGSPYRDAQAVDDVPQTLVVIGNGMMCFRLCQKLVECGANHVLEIVVFGEEPRPAYDRVHLTELFSGKTPESLTLAQKEWYEDNGIELYLDDPIVEIDREDCIVRSKKDRAVPYHRLVFATGSRPFVPPIAGADLPGVFVYRTVEHLEAIRDYSDGLTSAAVIGGGLLGLEAAKAVYDLGLEVHVVEVAPGLMPRQLDARGAELLKDKIEQLGVRIRLSTQTTRIEGIADQLGPYRAGAPKRAERILHFADGSSLAIDMVVISAGIRPRDELAAASGLKLAKNGGIVVDDHLTSSDPRIFAVGECAVHRGTTYGLAFPGYKMVDVLVDNLVGGTATFESADQSAKLKLMGVSVASMGAHSEMDARSTTVNSFDTGGVYRKLVMRDGKIVGAIAVGEWDNLDRVREAIDQPHLVSFRFWDMRRFRSTGNLWLRSESPPIAEWPEDALVCGAR
jgi:nitrite reductase (NADH) large subunit